MDDGSGGATALLGMEGFVVLTMTEHDGEWWLAVLLLRGPQTIGELRVRTDRMAEFDGLDDVQHKIGLLACSTNRCSRAFVDGQVRRRSGGTVRLCNPLRVRVLRVD
jgi:uncharacterized protein YceH (UPF0502 family)